MKLNQYLDLNTFTYENDVKDVERILSFCYPAETFIISESPFYPNEFICTSANKTLVGVKYLETGSLYDDTLKPLKLSITATFTAIEYFSKLRIYAVRSGVNDVETIKQLFQKATKTDVFLKIAAIKDNL